MSVAGFLASFYISMLFPVYHILLSWCFLRYEKDDRIRKVLLLSFFLVICTWLLVFISVPDLLISLNKADVFINGFCILLFTFIGYLECYSLLRRGFSLRILCELNLLNNSATKNELIKNYSGGRGLSWFAEKRLRGMEGLKLIDVRDNDICLRRPYGYVLAFITTRLIQLIGFKETG